MAEHYGYFNGIEYGESFVALVNKILVKNGVFDDGLIVSALSGMTVQVAEGAAIIDGFIYCNDTPMDLVIPTADATLPRIDSVMLRWDIQNRTMNLMIVTGTAQSNPSAPAPVRDGTYYDLQIATVQVNAGVASITAANITDTRPNENVCGITSGYNGVDIDALMTQYTAEFNGWFEQIKGQLSTDAAGNLQNQLDDIWEKIYPVGSIYLNLNETSPSALFGGTWEMIAKGRTLIGVNPSDSDFSVPNKTGGSKTKDLSHSHLQTVGAESGNIHIRSGKPNGGERVTANRKILNYSDWVVADAWYDNTGTSGSTAQEILPPYFTCYIWARTA